jgi:hypothetical protein
LMRREARLSNSFFFDDFLSLLATNLHLNGIENRRSKFQQNN